MPEIHFRNAWPKGGRRPAGMFGSVLVAGFTLVATLGIVGCQSDDPSGPEKLTPLTNIIAIAAEPEFTAGLENTIAWTVDGATALPAGWSYLAQRSTDPEFGADIVASDWLTEGQYTFAGLSDATPYYYRVRARAENGAESEWSEPVSSTQDAVAPIATVAELDADQTSLLFTLEISAEDAGSGVAAVNLWFSRNSGELQLYGPVEPGTVSFQTDAGGPHEFIALASDVAGNVQPRPEVAQATTVVPEQIILVDKTGYEWDVTNAVLKHSIHLQWWDNGLGRFTISPAINPRMAGPGQLGWLDEGNLAEVVAVDMNGDQRAYKIGDLNAHEVADDVVDGVPLAATY